MRHYLSSAYIDSKLTVIVVPSLPAHGLGPSVSFPSEYDALMRGSAIGLMQ